MSLLNLGFEIAESTKCLHLRSTSKNKMLCHPTTATDRSSASQVCTAKPSSLVQSDYGIPCQLMSASCRVTVLRLNWTPSSWCNCR